MKGILLSYVSISDDSGLIRLVSEVPFSETPDDTCGARAYRLTTIEFH